MRDRLIAKCHIGYGNVAFKQKLAVAGYEAISKPVIETSFDTAGLWPMDYRFTTDIMRRERP